MSVGSIIWIFIIIIGIIISQMKKTQQRTNGNTKSYRAPQQMSRSNQSQPYSRNYTQSQAGSNTTARTSGSYQNQSAVPNRKPMNRKPVNGQSMNKQPMRGQPMNNQANKAPTNRSILERANANVQENSADELRKNMETDMPQTKEAQIKNQTTAIDSTQLMQSMESSELMKQLDDLMIKGYTGELSFERDFVSEGIEMLNQFTGTEETFSTGMKE